MRLEVKWFVPLAVLDLDRFCKAVLLWWSFLLAELLSSSSSTAHLLLLLPPCILLCFRRAKRLRRIKQQLDSPLARMALQRFWRGMWLAAGVLLAAHVLCFAILAKIVRERQM
jgi:O-antigen ligase